jgi:hypothetical protein
MVRKLLTILVALGLVLLDLQAPCLATAAAGAAQAAALCANLCNRENALGGSAANDELSAPPQCCKLWPQRQETEVSPARDRQFGSSETALALVFAMSSHAAPTAASFTLSSQSHHSPPIRAVTFEQLCSRQI